MALAWPEAKTEDDGWVGRGISGEIAGPVALEQRFQSTGANLRAITFYATPHAEAVSGTAHLSLTEIRRDDTVVVDEREVPASDLVAADRYVYRFAPMPLSTRGIYRLTISVPDAALGTGIAVEVMHRQYGENPRNVLVFGGRDRWGSLRFTAEIDRPTMLVRTVRYFRDGALGSLTLVLVVALWIVLHVLGLRVIAMLAADAYRSRPPAASHLPP